MGNNTKTWIVVLLLGLGGIWQLRHGSVTPPPPPAVPGPLDDVDDGDGGSATGGGPPGLIRPPGMLPAGPPPPKSPPPPQPAEVSPETLAKFIAQNTQSGEVTDSAKKKVEEKCVPKLDPRTGKMTTCKTKKKKKKDKKDKTSDTTPPARSTDKTTPPPTPSSDIVGGVGAAIRTGQVTPTPAGGTKVAPFSTQDAWEDKLLGTPDLGKTKEFIAAFQANQVSSTTYYAITQKMLNDSREDMKLLGVMCAGVNPSSQGFTMLAAFVNASGQTATAGSVTQANAALAKYNTLTTLPILATVMRTTPSPNATVLAMQKLDETARSSFTTPTPATDPTAPAATAAAANKNSAAFTKFVPILQALANNTNASIKAQATSSLANLNSLLGTVATPTPGANTGSAPAPVVNPQSTGRGRGGLR